MDRQQALQGEFDFIDLKGTLQYLRIFFTISKAGCPSLLCHKARLESAELETEDPKDEVSTEGDLIGRKAGDTAASLDW